VQSALVPWLGRLSAGALEYKLSVIDRFVRISSFSQICSLSQNFQKCFIFFQKPIKQRKHKKESKIAKENKIKKLTDVN
jgi:hypothetical protein